MDEDVKSKITEVASRFHEFSGDNFEKSLKQPKSPKKSNSSTYSFIDEAFDASTYCKPKYSVGNTDNQGRKLLKFEKIFGEKNFNNAELIKLSWLGIPNLYRPRVWRILSKYTLDNNIDSIQQKRNEYFTLFDKYFQFRNEEQNCESFKQIQLDVPRTNVKEAILKETFSSVIYEHVLYIWSVRHPASGYVQGLNDFITPIYFVFLSEICPNILQNHDNVMEVLKEEKISKNLEADIFWILSKVLEDIQDNYIPEQPAIHLKLKKLKFLIEKINPEINALLAHHSIDYIQFAFRWFNNLLIRELPIECTLRLWDTYWCEDYGFSDFHIYVCASMLDHFSKNLLSLNEFQEIMLFLQNLPTWHWKEENIDLLLAQAFSIKHLWHDMLKKIDKL